MQICNGECIYHINLNNVIIVISTKAINMITMHFQHKHTLNTWNITTHTQTITHFAVGFIATDETEYRSKLNKTCSMNAKP